MTRGQLAVLIRDRLGPDGGALNIGAATNAVWPIINELQRVNERLEWIVDDQVAHALQNPGSGVNCRAERRRAELERALREIDAIDTSGYPRREVRMTYQEYYDRVTDIVRAALATETREP